tara:strand:- start:3079 stop:3570 length:492 start_codon:yes stop_codon:yes gene_type:complete
MSNESDDLIPEPAGDIILSEKSDPASDSRYDNNKGPQKEDYEILKRHRWNRISATIAMIAMGLLALSFFILSACFAFRFFDIYQSHIHLWVSNNPSHDPISILPLLPPLMPAFLFSLTGLLVLVTYSRFSTAYICEDKGSDEYTILERLIRDIISIIKGGRSE